MTRRAFTLALLATAVLVALLASGSYMTGTASAACPESDPDCGLGGGGSEPITETLYVVDSSQATVSATGINCGVAGNDCQESYTYAAGADVPSVTLTATGVPAGYTARLFSCTTATGSSCSGTESQCGVASCTIGMSANYRVRLSVADETPPSAATVSGPGKVGPSVRHFTA